MVELEASSRVIQLLPQDEGTGAKTLNTTGCDTIVNLLVINILPSESLIKEYVADKVTSFKSGQIANGIAKWRCITADSEVFNTVKRQFIDFCFTLKPKGFSTRDSLVIESEIIKIT